MNLEAKQLESKPRKIGDVHGKAVYHLKTKGGFHVLAMQKASGFETIGAGPHPAVARHLASKYEPDIVWTDLEKSEHVDPSLFALMLPKYEELTESLRALESQE